MSFFPRLIAITPESSPDLLWEKAQPAIEAGLSGILIRQPAWRDRAILEFVHRLRKLSTELWVSVHDRAHLSLVPEVDGVHLGFRSLPPTEVKRFLPANRVMGFSAHADDAERQREGADYLFFGPVFDTPSKRGLQLATGMEGLRAAVAESSVPVVALGGLRRKHVKDCLATGAAGMACLSDILGAEDPAHRVECWLAEANGILANTVRVS